MIHKRWNPWQWGLAFLISKQKLFFLNLAPPRLPKSNQVCVYACRGDQLGECNVLTREGKSRARKTSLWSQAWTLKGAGQGRSVGKEGKKTGDTGSKWWKRKLARASYLVAGTGGIASLLLGTRPHWSGPAGSPPPCLGRQKCLLETQHLLTCHRIKEEREIWHFPSPQKWNKKGFFTFRAVSWMTEVIFCNWSVWAQASNCFLNYLLSISHLAACQSMLMSPEFLAWSFEEQISCSVFGNVGLGVQALWVPLAETLSSSPLPLAVLRAMPRHSAQLPAVPERMPRNPVQSCRCPCGTASPLSPGPRTPHL